MIYKSNYYNSGYALLAADSGMLNQDTIKYFDLDSVIEASEDLVMAPVEITDEFKDEVEKPAEAVAVIGLSGVSTVSDGGDGDGGVSTVSGVSSVHTVNTVSGDGGYS